MSKYILYNNVLLQRGSTAYQLYTEFQQEKDSVKKKILKQKLDAGMKQTAASYKQLHGCDLENWNLSVVGVNG